jgi:hypothetical protein
MSDRFPFSADTLENAREGIVDTSCVYDPNHKRDVCVA